MLSKEDREYILKEHLRNIAGISDIEYQKRVWIKGLGPECDDFTETVCHFFDDGDPILSNYKEYNISENQYIILNKFRELFKKFADSHDSPEEFIDTPEWGEIMKMAKEVLEAFNYKKETSG